MLKISQNFALIVSIVFHVTRWFVAVVSFLTVCYYHVTYEFQSYSTLYNVPECQGTPCSKQAPYLKFKWQQRDSNPQHIVPKRTLNHLAKLASQLSVSLLIDYIQGNEKLCLFCSPENMEMKAKHDSHVENLNQILLEKAR